MGASIVYRRMTKAGGLSKEYNLSVGWRSMLAQLLRENGLRGGLNADDIPMLEEVALNQLRGQAEPPFDWSEDIKDACEKLIAEIREHKYIEVDVLY
jgi:hypothetical protein